MVALLERRHIDFLSNSFEPEYATAYHQAVVARQVDSYFRALPIQSGSREGSLRESMMVRDSAMAQNLKWVLDREGPDGRVLLFAHSGHVIKTAAKVTSLPVKPWTSMGSHLHSVLGESMVVLSTTFREAQGDFSQLKFSPVEPSSIDAQLAQLRIPAFALDLRTRPRPEAVERALTEPRTMRMNDQYGELKPDEAFDILVFLDKVGPVHVMR